MSEDELGYWGAGAYFAGSNWSGVLNHSAYYSYGYGLILAPFFYLSKSPVLMYRCAILLNCCFIAFAFWTSIKIFHKLFKNINSYLLMITSFVTFLYASYIVNSTITWSECLLILLFWLILDYMLRICEKPAKKDIFLLAFLLVFNYTVHQRTLGILVAGIIVILYMRMKMRITWSHLLIFVSCLLIFLSGHRYIKEALQSTLYNNSSLGNDYSALANSTLLYEWFDILKSVCGHLFYLGVSSFLFIYLGLFAILTKLIGKANKNNTFYPLLVFAMLAFGANIMISGISMRSPMRIDHAVYGRYNESITGFFLLYGMLCLFSIYDIRNIINLIASSIIMFLFCSLVTMPTITNLMPTKSFSAACAPAIFWFYTHNLLNPIFLFFITVTFLGILLTLHFKFKKGYLIYLIIGTLNILCGFYIRDNVILPYQENKKVAIYDITKTKENTSTDYLWYYYDDSFGAAGGFTDLRGIYQMLNAFTPLYCVTNISQIPANTPHMLIIANDVSLPKSVSFNYNLLCTNNLNRVYQLSAEPVEPTTNSIILPLYSFSYNTNAAQDFYYQSGPYISLDSGEYKISISFSTEAVPDAWNGMLDITSNSGKIIHNSIELNSQNISSFKNNTIALPFSINQLTNNMEFRIYLSTEIPLEIHSITLERFQ